MTPPELVIFDMDDVLCRYDLGRRLRALARLAATTPRDVRAAVWDSGFEDLADSGGYAQVEFYLEEFGKRLGHRLTVEQWIEARREAMTPNPEMLAMAEKLSTQTKLALYTNNGPVVKSHFDLLFPEAAKIIQLRFCSYEFGTKKPDPESYCRLMKALNRDPATTWFIDDKKSNVEGARIAGLRAHLFTGHESFAAEARNQGFTL